LKPWIKQVNVKLSRQGETPYEEVDHEKLLDDLYGNELPTRIDAWTSGHAEVRSRYADPRIGDSLEDFVKLTRKEELKIGAS
jgi:hypothetical protein